MIRFILQVNDKYEIVQEWNSIEDIIFSVKFKGTYRELIDEALKKGFRSVGYYWIWKHQWENGKRADLNKQIRNKKVYAYKYETLEFLGRFKNAVEASKFTKVSKTNIREILNGNKKTSLKGFWFNFTPLREEDDLISDIDILKEELLYVINNERYRDLEIELINKEKALIELREKILGI